MKLPLVGTFYSHLSPISIQQRFFPDLIRKRLRLWLILGLMPVFVILLIFAGLSGYAVHSRLRAGRIVGRVLEETSTVHSLHATVRAFLDPIAFPLDKPVSGDVPDPSVLVDSVEQLLYHALTLCDEPEEQAQLHELLQRWTSLRSYVDAWLVAGPQAGASEHEQLHVKIQTEARAILIGLDTLQLLVNTEVAETAIRTQFIGLRMVTLLGATFFCLLISLLALWVFFSRMITFPLETLRVGVEKSHQDELNYHLRLDRNDDLGAITHTVNKIVDHLQQRLNRTAQGLSSSATETADLQAVLSYVVDIQEAERKRLAMDIHDGVSQWLTGIFLKLEYARLQVLHDFPAINSDLQEAEELLQRVKVELKRTVQGLDPHGLENATLVEAIRAYLIELRQHGIINCTLAVYGRVSQLSRKCELALFRVVQEGLHNVAKHAQTQDAMLTLCFERERLYLRLADTGCGFDLLRFRQQPNATWGLLSMSERIGAIGGQFLIESKPGLGTNLIVEIPLTRTEVATVEEQGIKKK